MNKKMLAVMKDIYAKNKNKTLAIVAGVMVPVVLLAASPVLSRLEAISTSIHCEMANSCNFVIESPKVDVSNTSEGEFGANAYEITRWISGNFTDDLDVDDDLNVDGDLTVTGTTTLSGELSGIPRSLAGTMSSSATTTACTFLNSSGVTRTVVDTSVVDRGSASSLGAVAWQAGTSTANGANGSSAIVFTKAIASTITRLSGSDVITTTSTPQTALYPWKSGEYWNFISSTTTNSGTCRILFH